MGAKKRSKPTEEQLVKLRDTAFRRKIRTIFTTAGFFHLNTLHKHTKIGRRDIEVDAVFVYENVLLICEDTGAANKDKDHIRAKEEAFTEIGAHLPAFLEWLCATFPDQAEQLKRYSSDRYLVFNLYFSQHELNLTSDERALYSDIHFVEPRILNYFQRITQCIRLSSRYEIFRFLGVKKEQFGQPSSASGRKTIKAPIICPKGSTGLGSGVRVVSFMMSADLLLQTCYVLRKDNWEDPDHLYQRLINRDQIRDIRKFLAETGETFLDNIIVALPNNVRFITDAGDSIPIDKIGDYEACKLEIEDEWNSICVIDGQHRIFAHYEGPETDKYEAKIAGLRKQLHFLVTGLIFPPDMSPIDIARIQCQQFMKINDNSKSIPPDVLLQIEMLMDPFSDVGLARRVIERLNKESVFLNMFGLSSIDASKIKVASIVKFALRYLVTPRPSEDKASFYTVWDGDKAAFERRDERALKSYIDFCTAHLRTYFSAVKQRFSREWADPASKILSVTSLNGFIIAYQRQLRHNGIRDFQFYRDRLQGLDVDLSKAGFGYTSSQYRKFSDEILRKAFELETDG